MDPTQPPVQPIQPNSRKMSGRTKLALWLLIGPTALLILAILLAAVANFAFSTVDSSPSITECTSNIESTGITDSNGITYSQDEDCANELFSKASPGHTIINVILYIVGSISILTWLPGLITGIVLLATQKK